MKQVKIFIGRGPVKKVQLNTLQSSGKDYVVVENISQKKEKCDSKSQVI